MAKWLQIVMVGDMLSYDGDDCPPWLGAVAGCAINDGDGDDMLWMQLVKVGNVFDRAKAPAWAQPRPSHWTTMFLWESRRRRRALAAAMIVRPLLQL